MNERRTRLTARWKSSTETVAELSRERLLQPREEPAPERQRPTDDVLPEPALRLVQRRRDAGRERRALERRVHAPLVEAVAALVHRGEQREEVVVVVARRQTDVAQAERHLERVDGEIEPELVPRRPEPLDELA